MIRPMLFEDRDSALRVWLRASCAAHSFMPPAFWEEQLPFVRDICLPQCLNFVFVEEPAGPVLGFASLREADGCLGGLFVDPAWQGRGVGSRLFGLARRICPHLHAVVYVENVRAVAFYARQGMCATARRADPATGHDQWIMRLP